MEFVLAAGIFAGGMVVGAVLLLGWAVLMAARPAVSPEAEARLLTLAETEEQREGIRKVV